jgi:hypothetical protein
MVGLSVEKLERESAAETVGQWENDWADMWVGQMAGNSVLRWAVWLAA